MDSSSLNCRVGVGRSMGWKIMGPPLPDTEGLKCRFVETCAGLAKINNKQTAN